ncbi:MAG: bifunctional proline dehydrogenase/L-glutamate gamma-semialdehyde dehydrogenase, partial [bacterium]
LLQKAADMASGLPGFSALAGGSVRRNVLGLARRFIVAETPRKALPLLAKEWKAGYCATVDLLGEKAVSGKEARAYQERYLELLDTAARTSADWPAHSLGADAHTPRLNVSVKLSSIYSQAKAVDFAGTVAAVKERLRPIVRRARDLGAFINLDMETDQTREITLGVFQELLAEAEFAEYADAGLVVQAYHREAFADIERFLAWCRVTGRVFTVRLVKGAYWDYETILARQENRTPPVFEEKWRTDENFEKCCRLLMENHALVRTAIGSHNVRSIATALALEQAHAVPKGRLEFQMLYGMADPIKRALIAMGYPVRQYAPVGDLLEGMAYLVRRLLENTSNESFLRQRYVEGVDPTDLLRPPAPKGGQPVAETGGRTEPGSFRNVARLDFARAEPREKLGAAIEAMRARLPFSPAPLIGGSRISTGKTFQSVDPSHPRQIVGTVDMAGPAEAEQAVGVAKAAWGGWGATEPAHRTAILRRAARMMEARRFDLCAIMILETGKNRTEADLDVIEAIDFLNYYADEMERLAQPRRTQIVPGEDNTSDYRPKGVAVVIAPWNFPLAISTGMTAAALVTGNSVIYKPAETSPVTGWMMVEILHAAGIPQDVLSYLPGHGEQVGPHLVAHPDVQLIAFTGSQEVGLGIIATAGRTHPGQRAVKKVIAEMGGKNAIIVDSDADLDEALRGIVQSAFGYQGQKCSAASRVIALADIHDRLIERLAEAVKSLTVGPAEAAGTDVGPLIDQEAQAKAARYIEIGCGEGRLVVQNTAFPDEGYFAPPTVFADIAPGARLAQEEIFAPVVAVIKARDFAHALEIANGTGYSLTGGLYSRSPEHIEWARRSFRVGNLYINRSITGAVVQRQPFGGLGLSGVGAKAGGADYLIQFLDSFTVSENTTRQGFAPPGESGAGS